MGKKREKKKVNFKVRFNIKHWFGNMERERHQKTNTIGQIVNQWFGGYFIVMIQRLTSYKLNNTWASLMLEIKLVHQPMQTFCCTKDYLINYVNPFNLFYHEDSVFYISTKFWLLRGKVKVLKESNELSKTKL